MRGFVNFEFRPRQISSPVLVCPRQTGTWVHLEVRWCDLCVWNVKLCDVRTVPESCFLLSQKLKKRERQFWKRNRWGIHDSVTKIWLNACVLPSCRKWKLIEVGEHDACRSDRLEWILWQSSQLIEIRVMPVAVH